MHVVSSAHTLGQILYCTHACRQAFFIFSVRENGSEWTRTHVAGARAASQSDKHRNVAFFSLASPHLRSWRSLNLTWQCSLQRPRNSEMEDLQDIRPEDEHEKVSDAVLSHL